MNGPRREQLVRDLRLLVREEQAAGRDGLDSTMVASRVLRAALEALEVDSRRLGVLEEVQRTLNEVGAPVVDQNGGELNENGRLVDWIAGRRVPGWIGREPDELAQLRALAAKARTFLHEFRGDVPIVRALEYPEGQQFERAVDEVREVIKRD